MAPASQILFTSEYGWVLSHQMASLGDQWRWSPPLVTTQYFATKADVASDLKASSPSPEGEQPGPIVPGAVDDGEASESPLAVTLKRKRGGRKKAGRQPTKGDGAYNLIREWLLKAHSSLASPEGGFPMSTKDQPTLEPEHELDFVKFAELADISAPRSPGDCFPVDVDDVPLDDISGLFHAIVQNNSDACKTLNVLNHSYIIPPYSDFITSDLCRAPQTLRTLDPFDLIVMDPPWPNKSVQRAGSYDEIDVYDLFKIPGKRLVRPGGYVAVWFQEFVRNKLFSAWGLALVGEWYWLKVTAKGQWVFDPSTLHRKPYEIVRTTGVHNEDAEL
ncbi:Methyltransferase-like protein 4 [Geranomyces variabilis]|uniref:Methyltransferase-like protein 4 n=1 Tax=Geranomyces variabilis TaxID=109894 RepID=A0AAD5XI48_9FUNG|nr:Methyltransferase-like protein 4 [Geranomyces variabilis]